MTAIAGLIQVHPEPSLLEDGGRLMHSLQRFHADAVHTWHQDRVFLGCHAQWTTPESLHERLPHFDEQSQLAITADAILDNRQELFERLKVDSARRANMTDSDLILEAYREWGEEAPRHMLGDFAFVIWDTANERLFAARDLCGNRTLHYYQDAERFVFSTIMAPLFTLPYIPKELNESWLAEFLVIPGMFETADYTTTVYKNILQLPPAHSMVYEHGRVRMTRYGSVMPAEPLRLKSNEEYEEAFRDVFSRAVTSRIRTYREVGSTLSGGLDSGTVASFAAPALRLQGKSLHTYSYVPSQDFVDWTTKSMLPDERPFIQTTVQHVGNIQDQYLDFGGRSPITEINDLLELMDMPYKFFENSFWIRGIYERARQEGVGVLLTGARGNFTISWGPALEYYAILLKRMRLVKFYRELQLYSRNMGVGRSRVLPALGRKLVPSTGKTGNSIDTTNLISPEFARSTGVYAKLQEQGIDVTGNAFDAIGARQHQFENLSIASKNGSMSTNFSLAYALRERDPTCDPRVIEFCLSVPLEQYVQNGMDRALLRRSTKNYLPDKVRLNQRVRGVQGADWVHRMMPVWPQLANELEELCGDPAASRYLNVPFIRQALSEIGRTPKPEQAFSPSIRLLIRSIIVYRFLKKIS